jgi:hypothetical protein
MGSNDHAGAGPTRRALLRGGAVAGTAVWVAPVVQFVSATPAHAASPSAPPQNGGQDTGGGGTQVSAAAAGGSQVSSAGGGGSPTAETGPAVPLAPTIIAGAGAVAVGLGALAAGQVRSRRASGERDEYDAEPA